MSSEERYNARQTQSKPVIEPFYTWLDTVEPASGSNLAKAVQYRAVPQPSGDSGYAVVIEYTKTVSFAADGFVFSGTGDYLVVTFCEFI